jgi:hypothetical protein
MKLVLLSFFAFLIGGSSLAVGIMTRIPIDIYVNEGRTDFDSIFKLEKREIRKTVEDLFAQNLLNHELTLAYNTEAVFSDYWEQFGKNWHAVDLNKDGTFEYVFSGFPLIEEDKEWFEIYALEGKEYKSVYSQVGHLLAYKIHSNTGEVILFHHQYPCCKNASHNINMVRWISHSIHLRKKYFVARDKDMQGVFFPKRVIYPKVYNYLTEQTELRWSGSMINSNASLTSESNLIIHYRIGSPYKILAEENGWYFVLLCSPPIIEPSRVINPSNFTDMHIFGWIKK